MSTNKETIPAALGITNEWEFQNFKDIKKLLDDEELLSAVIIKHAKSVKVEEFGDSIEPELSLYEKKLIWSGMELVRILVQNTSYMTQEPSLTKRIRKK